MAKTLYVGSLPYETTDDELRELFGQAGEVASANVIKDKFSGRSRGFGFVEMTSDAEAEAAVNKFNGYQLGNRTITVNEARPKEDRPLKRDFGAGDGGGYRRRDFGGGRRGRDRY